MEFYFHVLIESILVSAPIPFTGNPTFFAMRGFGGYNMPLAVFLATAGSIIGTTISFIAGYLLLKMYRNKGGEAHLSKEKYDKAGYYFSRYLIYLMPFSFLPLLNFLALAGGFLSVRPKLMLSLAFIGHIAHYGYYLVK